MSGMLDALSEWAGRLEVMATDALAAVGPWLAPIPSAALVARASVRHLGWSNGLGLVVGAIVEILGLTATSTTLTLWSYNESKRKSDPHAPLSLSLALIGFYYGSVVGLTILLDIAPNLARYAPALFPTLALVGTVNLALRLQHKRRVAAIEADKQERKARRQASRKRSRQAVAPNVLNNRASDVNLDALQAGRRAKRAARLDALLTFYDDNPGAGPTDAARAVGVSRQTIYIYQKELEATGRLRKNGDGWEVL